MIVRVQSTELSSVQRFVRRLVSDWGPGTGRVGGVALLASPLPRSRRRSAPLTDLLVWTPHTCTLVVLADFGSVQHGLLTTGPTGRWQIGDDFADLRTGKSTPNPILRGRKQRSELAAAFRRHGLSEHIDVLVVLIPKTGSRISWTPPPPEDGVETILVRIGRSEELAEYFERPAAGGVRWRGEDIARVFEILEVSRHLPGAEELAHEGFVLAPGALDNAHTAGDERSGQPVAPEWPHPVTAISARSLRSSEPRTAAEQDVRSRASRGDPAPAAALGPAVRSGEFVVGTVAGVPAEPIATAEPGASVGSGAAPIGGISGAAAAGDGSGSSAREAGAAPATWQLGTGSPTSAAEGASQAATRIVRPYPAPNLGEGNTQGPFANGGRRSALALLRARFGGGTGRQRSSPRTEHGVGGFPDAVAFRGEAAAGTALPDEPGGSPVDRAADDDSPVRGAPPAPDRRDPDRRAVHGSGRGRRVAAGVSAGVLRGPAGAREIPARVRSAVASSRPAARPPQGTPIHGRPVRHGKGLRYPVALGTAGLVLAAVAATVFAASGFARFDVSEYGALCTGGEGNPTASTYSVAGPSPIYLGGELPEYSAFGPSEIWRPMDPAAVQLVACVAQERRGELVSTCQYSPEPGRPVGRTLNLFTAVYRLTLYEARTGNQLAAIEITGDQYGADPANTEPDSCRAASGAPEDGLPGRRHSRPSHQQIEQALTPFVVPASQRIRAAR